MGRLAMIFLESPANPTNVLVDVDAVVAARNTLFSDEEEKPPIVIDNTFLGPLWQKPLRHGVDMVVYSLTKYAGGHSDMVAGAVLGAKVMIERVPIMAKPNGTILAIGRASCREGECKSV